MEHLVHNISPIYDKNSTKLILGTFPSPKSRKTNFYYGNKQNRLWKILAEVFSEKIENNNEAKIIFLLKHKLAMWDLIAECDIEGAEDSTIKNVKPNDLKQILDKAKIKTIYTTGKTAFKLFQSLCAEKYSMDAIYLPSPSPANCAISFADMIKAYEVLKPLNKNYTLKSDTSFDKTPI